MDGQIVVVGNGMVGYKLVEKLVGLDQNKRYTITVFGEEPHIAYDRVHLSEYFTDSSAEELSLAPRSWYSKHGIQLLTGDPVVAIDPEQKTVKSHHGIVQPYDKLILATGSSPFVPPIPGADKDGVFVYRTIEDLDAIIAYGKGCSNGTVLGGGLLGLEAAKALLDMGLKTNVVEFAPRLMPRQLDNDGSQTLQNLLENIGLEAHLGKQTKEFTGGPQVNGLLFADGAVLPADMVVISAGIRPRDELAKAVGLQMGDRGGILVNDLMETSEKDIYAIGECAVHQGTTYGLVAPGYEMAEVVAQQIAGHQKAFQKQDMSTKLKLIGVDVASFGDPFCEHTPHHPIVYQNTAKGIYKRINVSPDGKRLLGGILVGEAEAYNLLLQMATNGMKVPKDAESLIMPSGGGSAQPAGVGVGDLPGNAMICSCENISKDTLCQAVKDGTDNLADLKSCTKAGTGCGGCLPMVKDLLNHSLKEMGVSVKQSICEHFGHSRQELYHLIKVQGLTSYAEVIQHHGTGHGCEICKPLVASILASMHNDKVLKEDTIQDTNDRYLANIQRNGTYSVVPRIPGGEITPERLIVLGQVAKEYNLYTKITGGQRIDLFGAYLNDLPDIWEKLIDAGFETGQAYGKSVRTVKSCVGSTWCRYGVQDAMATAIAIEDRYKGLRAPHKIKFAVSGCTRECAEAQSKDIGLIATEKGWALYVCGNGGMKPQHAVLLATDLDYETCIKYIDRLLAFYIQTAEPLNRTATWLNKLEGGVAYLQDVIVNDSLGICHELEAHMQHHVDTFHCEWKDVVEDPAKRSKFTHFVNTNEHDPTIDWVDIRGQKAPL